MRLSGILERENLANLDLDRSCSHDGEQVGYSRIELLSGADISSQSWPRQEQ